MSKISPEAIAAVIDVYNQGITDCRSYTAGGTAQRKTIWFENADNDQLRMICDWHAPGITRQQLLAACRNRYPCGFYYEIEGPTT